MTEDSMQATLATWAAKNLPARLDVGATAKLLGFAEHDIQILMASGKLTPLGNPAPNAPKWFAVVEMIRLAADQDWLHIATKEITKYWRHKRDRHINALPLTCALFSPVTATATGGRIFAGQRGCWCREWWHRECWCRCRSQRVRFE